MAKRLFSRVKFGHSAWLGGGKIVNTAEQADMFSDTFAAHDAVEAWRESQPEPDAGPIEFQLTFCAAVVADVDSDEVAGVDTTDMKDHSIDTRG